MTIFVDNRPLLDAFRAGERAALGAVYDAYVGKVIDVLRYGFRIDGRHEPLRFRGFDDPIELESFVQDVFLRAFAERARLAYDGLRPYGPYLLQIARHVAIDELRRRQADLERVAGPLESEDAPVDDREDDTDRRLDLERARRLVREFVGSRSPLEQRFVTHRYAQELPLTETARRLGMSRMRARLLELRLHRALARHLQRGGYLGELRSLVCLALGVAA